MYQIEDLTNLLSRLPGIGKKNASRISFHLIKNHTVSTNLLTVLSDVIENIKPCKICGKFTTSEICNICSDTSRDNRTLCIIEEQKDMQAIEDTGIFKGKYHILMGTINPLDGIGPDKLRITELSNRIKEENIAEILVATNPTIEGEATFLFLKNLISSISENIKISKIATGIPLGGSIEYADKQTLSNAILSKNYY